MFFLFGFFNISYSADIRVIENIKKSLDPDQEIRYIGKDRIPYLTSKDNRASTLSDNYKLLYINFIYRNTINSADAIEQLKNILTPYNFRMFSSIPIFSITIKEKEIESVLDQINKIVEINYAQVAFTKYPN